MASANGVGQRTKFMSKMTVFSHLLRSVTVFTCCPNIGIYRASCSSEVTPSMRSVSMLGSTRACERVGLCS